METTQPALRREAQRVRHRHAWWIAVAAGVAGNGLLVLAMWAAAPRPAPAAVSVMPAQAAPAPVIVSPPIAPPVIVVVPAPAAAAAPTPAAFGDLGPCPAPYKARPSGALRQPPLDDEIAGFAGAPTDSRWLVLWTQEDVFASRDGGASWDRVLDGPGDVLDASFDCHGRVLALRDGYGLGLRDGSRETWRVVPAMALRAHSYEEGPFHDASVVGGGRSIAIVGPRESPSDGGEAVAAISDDGGTTWRHASLDWYEGRTAAAWDGDTLRVAVPWTDCMSEGIRLVTVTARGTKQEELDEWSSEIAMHGGAVHGVSWDCPVPGRGELTAERGLCTWRQGRGWTTVPLVPEDAGGGDAGYDLTLVDGPVDVLVRGAIVQGIVGRKLGRAREWPVGATALGTDLAGRLWGKDADGALIRR